MDGLPGALQVSLTHGVDGICAALWGLVFAVLIAGSGIATAIRSLKK